MGLDVNIKLYINKANIHLQPNFSDSLTRYGSERKRENSYILRQAVNHYTEHTCRKIALHTKIMSLGYIFNILEIDQALNFRV